MPVYEDTIDNIKGILFVKDLLKYLHGKKTIKIKNLLILKIVIGFLPASKQINYRLYYIRYA